MDLGPVGSLNEKTGFKIGNMDKNTTIRFKKSLFRGIKDDITNEIMVLFSFEVFLAFSLTTVSFQSTGKNLYLSIPKNKKKGDFGYREEDNKFALLHINKKMNLGSFS